MKAVATQVCSAQLQNIPLGAVRVVTYMILDLFFERFCYLQNSLSRKDTCDMAMMSVFHARQEAGRYIRECQLCRM